MEDIGASGGTRELNKATARVLEVLTSFAKDVPGYGVTELSQLLGMTKNMTYRALTTLVEQGYLMRSGETARYQLGYRILELQSSHTIEPDFRTLCGPYLKRIHLLTGESVSLAVRALDYCVLIDGIETRKRGVWRVRIGDVLPLFGPASGRVMLAFASDDEITDYIARNRPMVHPRTGETFTPDDIRRQIAIVREQGYARVIRPAPSSMVSLSFPVRDLDGGLHGAISVGGPPERSDTQLDAHMDELFEIVDELNSRSRLFSANAAGSELH
jgi:IclR family acetate operon transcriptional repressor